MNRRILAGRTFVACDPAESDSDTADFSAIGTGLFIKQGDLFMLDRWSKRGSDPIEILTEVFRQMRVYKCTSGFIERNRFESLMRTCRKLVDAGWFGDDAKQLVNRISLIPHYGKSKMERFKQNIVPYTKARKVWIRNSWTDYKDFFIQYPAVDHDDLGDVLDILIEHGTVPSREFIDHIPEEGRIFDERQVHMSINAQFAKKKLNIMTGVAN
jgi:hypothetical protein